MSAGKADGGGGGAAGATAIFASAGIIGVNASGSATTEMGDVELRSAKNDSYSTKQQDKAASGPDGIDQFELAKTQVTKVAKSAFSEENANVQLRKEVILGLMKSSTVFINYLAAAALDKTHEAGNKTMSAQHVLQAFKEMEFPEQYYAQLRKEYNDKQKAETEKSAAAKGKDVTPSHDNDEGGEEGMEVDDVDRDAAAIGEESLAVGDETLAAADGAADAGEEDEEEEDEEEDEA